MTVEPMTAAHIAALADIERLCFSEPWSADALRQEGPMLVEVTVDSAIPTLYQKA